MFFVFSEWIFGRRPIIVLGDSLCRSFPHPIYHLFLGEMNYKGKLCLVQEI